MYCKGYLKNTRSYSDSWKVRPQRSITSLILCRERNSWHLREHLCTSTLVCFTNYWIPLSFSNVTVFCFSFLLSSIYLSLLSVSFYSLLYLRVSFSLWVLQPPHGFCFLVLSGPFLLLLSRQWPSLMPCVFMSWEGGFEQASQMWSLIGIGGTYCRKFSC